MHHSFSLYISLLYKTRQNSTVQTIQKEQNPPSKLNMDIWPWICELPITQEWDESPSQLVFPLATSKPSQHSSSTQSIQLIANRVSGSDSDGSLTFSVCLSGFEAAEASLQELQNRVLKFLGSSKMVWLFPSLA